MAVSDIERFLHELLYDDDVQRTCRVRHKHRLGIVNGSIITLELSKCNLTVLHPAFKAMSQLTALDLHDNQLTVVDSFIKSLSGLTTLDISQNNIAILPAWLGQMKSLTTLKAHGNPLSGDQKQFAERLFGSSSALLGYLRLCREQVDAKRLTVTVLGHFMTGKTALINALFQIAPPKQEERTPHVTFAEYTDSKSDLSFSLRELPGQAQFYVGNQRFLYSFNNALAIVVVKLTDIAHKRELEQLRLYLSRMQHNASIALEHDPKAEPRAATIVICTHLDQFLEEKRGTPAELQEWARDTNKLLRTDYPVAGVCGENK